MSTKARGPLDVVRDVVSAVRVIARFLTGRPLDGTRRTDATFFRTGTRSLRDAAHYGNRMDYWPGWRVLLFRLGLVGAIVLFLPLVTWLVVNPSAVDTLGMWARRLLIPVGLVAVVQVARQLARMRMHEEVVRPAAQAIAPHLGYDDGLPIRRWLRVPRHLVTVPPSVPAAWVQEFAPKLVDALEARAAGGVAVAERPAGSGGEGSRAIGAGASRPAVGSGSEQEVARPARRPFSRGALALVHWWAGFREGAAEAVAPVSSALRARNPVVHVAVPHALGSVPAQTREAIVSGLTTKLGGSWESEWKLRGRRAGLVLRPRPEPPGKVKFAEFAERMALAGQTELALGLSAGKNTVSIDLDSDSPHVLLSMGSGAGKSVLIRLLAAQALAKGWAVILLDFKQDHYWAADLMEQGVPGIAYFRKVEEIHEAILALETVRAYRSDIDFAARGKQPMQRCLILFEEMNASVNMLRSYWSSIKEKGDPAKSPALTAFAQLSAAGRSANMNLVAVGQYLTAQVFGGPEARENFGARLLARYTVASWRTLVPEFGAPPPRSSVRGRIQVCTGDSPTETQVAFLTHEEVRRYAAAGLAGVVPAGTIPFTWTTPDSVLSPVLERGRGTVPIAAGVRYEIGGDQGDQGDEGVQDRPAELPGGEALPAWLSIGVPEGQVSPVAKKFTQSNEGGAVWGSPDPVSGRGLGADGRPHLRLVRTSAEGAPEGSAGAAAAGGVRSGPVRTGDQNLGSGQHRAPDMSGEADAVRPSAELRTLAEWSRAGVLGDIKPGSAERRRTRERKAGTCTLPADRNVYTESEVLAWFNGSTPAPGKGAGQGPGS